MVEEVFSKAIAKTKKREADVSYRRPRTCLFVQVTWQGPTENTHLPLGAIRHAAPVTASISCKITYSRILLAARNGRIKLILWSGRGDLNARPPAPKAGKR